jgi:lipid II:glycine glycyltransferase (peptidoglycan interpeptide bridge formation enzyme)
MKNIYKNYILRKEKLIAEKTKAINKTIKNARNINVAVAKLIDDERNTFNELVKSLANADLSDFFREFQSTLDLNKNITEL